MMYSKEPFDIRYLAGLFGRKGNISLLEEDSLCFESFGRTASFYRDEFAVDFIRQDSNPILYCTLMFRYGKHPCAYQFDGSAEEPIGEMILALPDEHELYFVNDDSVLFGLADLKKRIRDGLAWYRTPIPGMDDEE
jgi:hypothetical protein